VTYSARILADSLAPSGVRLTTMQVCFPRFLLPEWNTHRMLSRNAASSRAIPVRKLLEQVESEPFIPEYWGANKPGMQATEELSERDASDARATWLLALDAACDHARVLMSLGAHKQLANRLLEPFSWCTVIVSATTWENLFALRCHADAQPEFRRIACMMRDELGISTPRALAIGEWHLPLMPDLEQLIAEDYPLDARARISAARCARVSYLTHDGQRAPASDLELSRRLIEAGHMSPFEHVAQPSQASHTRSGNFHGWYQYRKRLESRAS
jgi:thymidylate synthase ThyX